MKHEISIILPCFIHLLDELVLKASLSVYYVSVNRAPRTRCCETNMLCYLCKLSSESMEISLVLGFRHSI